ncbi:MAG: amidase domain-containing protein [Oscillospiraceae bacterium]
MLALLPYDRAAAVRYAHLWAYGRNPRYYDYEGIGGDCTNFASQCIYAGAGVMNDTPTFGWYYINANDKAPAWTGVEYLHNFLTRRTPSVGPFAGEVSPERIRPGDIVQLSFDWRRLAAFAGRRGGGPSAQLFDILVAAHSFDADDRPLSTYEFVRARFLHIGGVYRQG